MCAPGCEGARQQFQVARPEIRRLQDRPLLRSALLERRAGLAAELGSFLLREELVGDAEPEEELDRGVQRTDLARLTGMSELALQFFAKLACAVLDSPRGWLLICVRQASASPTLRRP